MASVLQEYVYGRDGIFISVLKNEAFVSIIFKMSFDDLETSGVFTTFGFSFVENKKKDVSGGVIVTNVGMPHDFSKSLNAFGRPCPFTKTMMLIF